MPATIDSTDLEGAIGAYGILNNMLYVGVRVWNRSKFRRNPETDKKNSRLRTEDEIVSVDVPHLRIVDDELWTAVKARQGKQRTLLKGAAPQALRRRKFLLSGLVKCGQCGGNMTVAGAGDRRAYYCANAKEKGPSACSGFPGLRLDKLQPAVLSALRNQLLTPDAVEHFQREFAARMKEERSQTQSQERALTRAIGEAQKAIDGCMRAIRADAATRTVYDELRAAEEKKASLEARISELPARAPELPANLSELYRAQIDALADLLSDPDVIQRASEVLGELIDRIIVHHSAEHSHTVEIEGKLLELLYFSDTKNAAALSGAARSLKLVAGVGFEPTTFRL